MTGMSLGCEESVALAKKIRVQTARMIHRARSSHLGSAYSIADLLAVLYGKILQIDPQKPEAAERDRFVLSKGHACAPLYAILAERGFFPKEWLEGFYQDGARLAGGGGAVGGAGAGGCAGGVGRGLPFAGGVGSVGGQGGGGHGGGVV